MLNRRYSDLSYNKVTKDSQKLRTSIPENRSDSGALLYGTVSATKMTKPNFCQIVQLELFVTETIQYGIY